MPIRSQAQRAYLHMHHPRIAKRWERETPKGKLPQHVSENGPLDDPSGGDVMWTRKWAPDEEPLPNLGEIFGLTTDDDKMRGDDVRADALPEDVPDDLSPRMYFGWTSRSGT